MTWRSPQANHKNYKKQACCNFYFHLIEDWTGIDLNKSFCILQRMPSRGQQYIRSHQQQGNSKQQAASGHALGASMSFACNQRCMVIRKQQAASNTCSIIWDKHTSTSNQH